MLNQRKRERIFVIDEKPEPVYLADDRTVSDKLGQALNSLKRGATRKVFGTDPREEVVENILPVLDGFERLLDLADQTEIEGDETLSNWLKSIQVLHKRLVKALQKVGVKPIETVGSKLDLDVHEVEQVINTEWETTGTVLEEIQKGYKFHEKVLRPAKVAVAKNASREQQSEEPSKEV